MIHKKFEKRYQDPLIPHKPYFQPGLIPHALRRLLEFRLVFGQLLVNFKCLTLALQIPLNVSEIFFSAPAIASNLDNLT